MYLAQWRTQRARAKQKRIALQMLALSGVVRPSHVEPRYGIPLLKLKAFDQAPIGARHRSEPIRQPDRSSPAALATHRIATALSVADRSLMQWLKRFVCIRTGVTQN
jgi:hypothetical protein